MKTVNLAKQRLSVAHLLELAREENVLVRTEAGEEFLLAEVDDFGREVELTRQNKELMALLEARSERGSYVSLAEARKRLGL